MDNGTYLNKNKGIRSLSYVNKHIAPTAICNIFWSNDVDFRNNTGFTYLHDDLDTSNYIKLTLDECEKLYDYAEKLVKNRVRKETLLEKIKQLKDEIKKYEEQIQHLETN